MMHVAVSVDRFQSQSNQSDLIQYRFVPSSPHDDKEDEAEGVEAEGWSRVPSLFLNQYQP